MILVDTSIQIDHLAKGDAQLSTLLKEGEVLVHPYVIGAMARGGLQRRKEILEALLALPHAPTTPPNEAMDFPA